MFNKILIFLVILIIILLIIIKYYNNNFHIQQKSEKNTKNIAENFIIRNDDPDNDGKMKFSYLINPRYTEDILSKYYLNDDTREYNNRSVIHPTQTPRARESWLFFIKDTSLNKKYYGNLYYNNIYSNNIYKETSIRL